MKPKIDLPYKVIGKYVPPKWNIKRVTKALEEISLSAGLKPLPVGSHRLHKGPYQNSSKHSDLMRRAPKYDDSDKGWHQDGDATGANMDCALVLWASNNPTEFMYEGKVYQPKPYEVIVANNRRCTHRRPEEAPRVRWLFRQRVNTPEFLK